MQKYSPIQEINWDDDLQGELTTLLSKHILQPIFNQFTAISKLVLFFFKLHHLYQINFSFDLSAWVQFEPKREAKNLSGQLRAQNWFSWICQPVLEWISFSVKLCSFFWTGFINCFLLFLSAPRFIEHFLKFVDWSIV